MFDHEPNRDKLINLVRRAWRDPAFKSRLLASPHEVLATAGIDVPDGVTIEVLENDASTIHLVLPMPPSEELSEKELEKIAGGYEHVLRSQVPG